MKVKIEDKEYEVHEMLAVDFDLMTDSKTNPERLKILHLKCSNINEEDYNKLTISQRSILTKAINKCNHWGKEDTDETVIENESKKKD